MSQKIKVLFVCVHNSARSQMAEAFLNSLAADQYEACSAGLTPGVLNPLVVEVMREAGIDISRNQTKDVTQFLHEPFDYIVTVCDETSAEQCPVFPGNVKRLHWGFPDPSLFAGTNKEKLIQIRRVRDQIRGVIKNWTQQQKGKN